ncbi:MAG: methionine--tRNA ligase [Candidatus Hydrogenedentes bacterium]|nr:methionine--tRNA ligase [Candidatus Hydrogenedentota bacterium]
MSNTAFVSTAIPYVNAKPHVGFAFELVQADAVARYLRLIGRDCFFLTGTDENSLKNVRAAAEEGLTTRELCDRNTEFFKALLPGLNISNTEFIRTSSELHTRGAQELWSRTKPEDIYKKHYSGLYCVGCEDFYSEKEAEDGKCPEHKTPLEHVEEENYFFRLSSYEEKLLELIESDRMRIVPASKRNETLSFIRGGLLDFSISRSRKRAGDWGIPVPGDADQVMYVWYDALANYLTALELTDNSERLKKYWLECDKRIHCIGKGINRFHTVYWPAILMSVELPAPTEVFIHGYLTMNGQKISKSLGNVIDPLVQVEHFGVEAVRYFLLRAISPFEDGDYSESRFHDVFNADLANNLGNLARRIETIGEKAGHVPKPAATPEAPEGYHEAMEDYRFHDAMAALWAVATNLNQRIEKVKPWALQKEGKKDELAVFLDEMIAGLGIIGHWLTPFMPGTAERLQSMFKEGKAIKRGDPLFPRLK